MWGGRLYFRVLGGLAADREGLTSVRDSVARAIGEDASGWAMRDTPLAFELGEYTEAGAAQGRVGELEGLGVPAYALVVDRAEGARYRVYAGAFADEGEASELLKILRAAGVGGMRLTELRGRFGG
ncbi:MAG: SPOR domain-containing protein [Longimicrobiales bacterium]|nr:SPOR domain-containing protein [Longimicrobiales bacterium]